MSIDTLAELTPAALLSNPAFQFIGGALLSGLVGYWIRPGRVPRYAFTVATVQQRVHPDVSITFRGQRVDDLRVLRIAFWNAGRKEIRREDIPEVQPPSVQFAKGTQLYSIASAASDRATGARAEQAEEPARVRLIFQYLNHYDGVIAEVLYSPSPDADEAPFTVTASVIGGAAARGREVGFSDDPFYELVAVTLGIAQFVYLGVISIPYSPAIGGAIVIACGAAAIAATRRFFARRIPKWVRDAFGRGRLGVFMTGDAASD